MISFDEFQKIDLRVAKIISAEPVPGSEKLLKLVIDLGDETRQIVSGIGKNNSPASLINSEVVVVANLEPKELFGLESNGMLLAAKNNDGSPIILIPKNEVPPGSKVT